MSSSVRGQPPSFDNIVGLCGTSTSTCGYCHGQRADVVGRSTQDCSESYGLLVSTMSAHDYEHLLTRGWRRSGLHLYKPHNWDSCCPLLTIRLPVDQFVPTKSQRRVQHKLQQALQPKPLLSTPPASSSSTSPTVSSTVKSPARKSTPAASTTITPWTPSTELLQLLETKTRQALTELLSDHDEHRHYLKLLQGLQIRYKQTTVNNAAGNQASTKRTKQHQHTVVLTTTICATLEGRSKRKLSKGDLAPKVAQALSSMLLSPLTLATILRPTNMTMQSISSHSPSGHVLITMKRQVDDELNDNNTTTEMETEDYSTLQSHDKIGQWLQSRCNVPPERIHPPYRLEVTTLPALDSALYPDVHKLYFHYQHKVHGDPDVLGIATNSMLNRDNVDEEESEEPDWGDASAEWRQQVEHMLRQEYSRPPMTAFASFYGFLVASPLPVVSVSECATTIVPGSYHQHYRVEGQLIAVGVVDVLPHGLSSVYAFYDPDFAHDIAPLGKYAILHEIQVVQSELHLPYYYLGYFLESCQKMRYKADYHPSELLCPKYYKWVDAKEARQMLLRESPIRNCCALYHVEGTVSGNEEVSFAALAEQVRLKVGTGPLITVRMLNIQYQAMVQTLLEEFLKEVGPDLGSRCIVKLM